MKKCKEYRDDFNYLDELEKCFEKKDMLLLSLYQEWVTTRYNKHHETSSRMLKGSIGVLMVSVIMSIPLTLATIFVSLYISKPEPNKALQQVINMLLDSTLLYIPAILLFIISIIIISIIRKDKQIEDDNIKKLNALKESIDYLNSKKV